MTEAKTLVLGFEGFFTCRVATDPDPTDEALGVSGYTMALVKEDPLDQVIRMQVGPDFAEKNLRPPLGSPPYADGPTLGWKVGVRVTSAKVDNKNYRGTECLIGAKVALMGNDDGMFDGPIFSSRNNITGSDNTLSFVIEPFDLTIDAGAAGWLRAKDHVDMNQPEKQLWQIADPEVYKRRLTHTVTGDDAEVKGAIGVYNFEGYMQDRVRYLQLLIEAAENAKVGASKAEMHALEVDIQGYKSRIHQINFWGSRVYEKLGVKCTWQFDINGKQEVRGDFGGQIDVTKPWHFECWFGGWDGDLLLGYSRGSLSVPFVPD